jgi:hypothetical protein
MVPTQTMMQVRFREELVVFVCSESNQGLVGRNNGYRSVSDWNWEWSVSKNGPFFLLPSGRHMQDDYQLVCRSDERGVYSEVIRGLFRHGGDMIPSCKLQYIAMQLMHLCRCKPFLTQTVLLQVVHQKSSNRL